ncbi:DUF5133 domain-containing protein [Streptomyces sp. CBMA29]|uniref:DUF5133 domain-containing protein n=1 Tax=Streptomyces sp. CBMA29 TaxID=1896314 RepID=UPI001661AC7E|nr:DUF5133 domain-containing protein [Streptomyces sp. CBMA29]MBD0734834.1 hypothetical protein [Streptomyces sp. CBMA29]
MLMAHPTVLRNLVDRYETLTAEVETAKSVDPRVRQQLQDTAYTLCVSTGTREITPALAAARVHMERDLFMDDDEDEDASAA